MSNETLKKVMMCLGIIVLALIALKLLKSMIPFFLFIAAVYAIYYLCKKMK